MTGEKPGALMFADVDENEDLVGESGGREDEGWSSSGGLSISGRSGRWRGREEYH